MTYYCEEESEEPCFLTWLILAYWPILCGCFGVEPTVDNGASGHSGVTTTPDNNTSGDLEAARQVIFEY